MSSFTFLHLASIPSLSIYVPTLGQTDCNQAQIISIVRKNDETLIVGAQSHFEGCPMNLSVSKE